MNTTLLCIQKQFLGIEQAKESLEMVLAAASLEIKVSVLFLEDGVFQLINPALSKLLTAFPLYDIQNIYVVKESLAKRNLLEHRFVLPVTQLSLPELIPLFNQHTVII